MNRRPPPRRGILYNRDFWDWPKNICFLYNVAHTINISLMIAKLINLQVNDNRIIRFAINCRVYCAIQLLIYGTYVLRAFCKQVIQ